MKKVEEKGGSVLGLLQPEEVQQGGLGVLEPKSCAREVPCLPGLGCLGLYCLWSTQLLVGNSSWEAWPHPKLCNGFQCKVINYAIVDVGGVHSLGHREGICISWELSLCSAHQLQSWPLHPNSRGHQQPRGPAAWERSTGQATRNRWGGSCPLCSEEVKGVETMGNRKISSV